MNVNAFGEMSAGSIKKFFGGLLKNNYLTNENMKTVDTTSVQISKISGKLATATTPTDWVVDTMMYSK